MSYCKLPASGQIKERKKETGMGSKLMRHGYKTSDNPKCQLPEA